MNHFHLSIKFNMGEVLYSFIISVMVGLLYLTSVDGHVLRCKYFFYIFFFWFVHRKQILLYTMNCSQMIKFWKQWLSYMYINVCTVESFFIRWSQWSWLAKPFLVCRLSLTRGCATQSLFTPKSTQTQIFILKKWLACNISLDNSLKVIQKHYGICNINMINMIYPIVLSISEITRH